MRTSVQPMRLSRNLSACWLHATVSASSNPFRSRRFRLSPRAKYAMTLKPFDYSLDFTALDFRKQPELYRVGKGEQGVLLIEPYKSEILPYWRFKTAAEADTASLKIYKMFRSYLRKGDFAGADMARKFLQMGWTRARRYANHQGGRKYQAKSGKSLPRIVDAEKAKAAAIFYDRYVAARGDEDYVRRKQEHRAKYETL